MKSFTALLFMLFAFSAGAAPSPVFEINFGKNAKHGTYITARELSLWGVNRKLSLIGDCSYRDLQNYEAEVIPGSGMTFSMNSPGSGRIYLYLDLVSFIPQTVFEPGKEGDYCSGRPDRIYSPEHKESMKGVKYLEILVNGKSLKTVYTGEGSFHLPPQIITVDREHVYRGKINVTLKPSPGETFFAVWDAFVSLHGEGR